MAAWQLLLVVVATATYVNSASPGCKTTTRGVEYTGLIAWTKHGDKCKLWTASSKWYKWNFPDYPAEVSAVKNYCRNPDKMSGGPWCYEENGGWEYCDVPRCLDNCKTTAKGLEYTGTTSYSEPGHKCLHWNDDRVTGSSVQDKNFPDGSIAAAQKYCRNPDGSDRGLWCYVNKKYYEFCDVALCSDLPKPGCKTTAKGTEYTGQINYTEDYWMCQRWDAQSPHTHTWNKTTHFPDNTLDDAANYCRNPDSSDRPWCYTTNPDKSWDYCDVPQC